MNYDLINNAFFALLLSVAGAASLRGLWLSVLEPLAQQSPMIAMLTDMAMGVAA